MKFTQEELELLAEVDAEHAAATDADNAAIDAKIGDATPVLRFAQAQAARAAVRQGKEAFSNWVKDLTDSVVEEILLAMPIDAVLHRENRHKDGSLKRAQLESKLWDRCRLLDMVENDK